MGVLVSAAIALTINLPFNSSLAASAKWRPELDHPRYSAHSVALHSLCTTATFMCTVLACLTGKILAFCGPHSKSTQSGMCAPHVLGAG